jgi:serine/threonine-protein kinase HipA
MVARVDVATVALWGETVGAVAWDDARQYAVFEFEPAFVRHGWDISPLHMPIQSVAQGNGLFSFPALDRASFHGLPGLLADALPDKFGNRIIDAWLARQGRDPASFSPIERLCYTGKRGMGALEFKPSSTRQLDRAMDVEIADLVAVAQAVMQERDGLAVQVGNDEQDNADAMRDILRVGTSAGGARPKAVIAMNAEGKVVSGQSEVPPGYDYWLLKFDGVTDLELGKPQSFGRIEYAYYLMAQDAGIDMTECRLLEENGRAHFMTRRFDRLKGQKIHMQSLCGLAHFDFNQAGAYSYEQAFQVMRQLRLSKRDAIEQYRRMVLSVLARNQDDHTKNITFLMGPDGEWRLSPAYDVTYAHNPGGLWTHQHQMSINGKRDGFVMDDLLAVADNINLPRPMDVIEPIQAAVADWPKYADEAGLASSIVEDIGKHHRKL